MPSNVIRSFEYLEPTRELRVVFTTGRIYRYQDVPPEIHTAMRAAFSKGTYFNAHVREAFAFIRETLER